MELQSFRIHGFGHFADAGIDELPRGLTVICADNGGGKTTLRDFLRAALFGFTRDDPNRYAVDTSHAYGGAIRFALRDGGAYQLLFDARKKKSTVKAVDGQPCPELSMLLGSATAQLYRNVFAIGLHELQDARHLDDEKVQTMIGAFGSGQSGQVFQSARNSLLKEMDERFKPSGQNPRANKLMAGLKVLQDELKRLKADAETYWEHEQRLQELSAEIEVACRAESELRARSGHLRTLAQAWEDWVGLNRTEAQLAQLSLVVETFPAGGASRLNDLNERLESLRETLKGRVTEFEKSREQLERLVVPQEVLAASGEIDAACERYAIYEQNCDRARRAAEELKLTSSRQQAELERLGAGWDAARLAAFGDDVASQAERAEAARLWREARQTLALREKEHERLTADCTARSGEAATARSEFAAKWPEVPASQAELDKQALALSNVRGKLAELGRLTDKKQQFERELAAAEAEVTGLQGKLQAPVATPAPDSYPFRNAAWAVLALGFVLAAVLYQTPVAAVCAMLICLAGFVLGRNIRVAAPAASQADHSAWFEGQVVTWQGRAQAARQALEENERESAAVSGQLNALCQSFGRVLRDDDCTALQARLLKAGEARREWEQEEARTAAKEQAAGAAERELQASSLRLSEAGAQYETARSRWNSWLRAHSLADDLSPEAAEAVCQQVAVARTLAHELETQKTALEHLQRQQLEYEQEITRVFEQLGRPVPAQSELSAALRRLRDERDTARESAKNREALELRLPELQAAQEKAGADVKKCYAERQALLEAGGAAGDDEFMARAAAFEARERLLAEVRAHLGRLEVLSGPGAAVQRLKQELAGIDWETLEGRRTQTETELAQASELVKQLSQQRGQREEACSRLAGSEEVAACQARIESAAAELNDVAEEWAVRKVALMLMNRARDKFETERQPAVLQSAGASLATMTGGRVTRIIKPLEGGRYRLVRESGEALGDDATWNTALKEQTYLSLRFGLIDVYCRRTEPLPIVLDDALVNMDPRHLQGAVNCIAELASRHQVIYLTCHPHTMRCFAASGAEPAFFRIHDRAFHEARPAEFLRSDGH